MEINKLINKHQTYGLNGVLFWEGNLNHETCQSFISVKSNQIILNKYCVDFAEINSILADV